MMQELLDAFNAYVYGGPLPDDTAPTYTADMPGLATAGLTKQVADAVGDLGFGTDLSCWDDLASDYGLVDPTSQVAVLQSNFRRITTRLGSLADIGESIDDTCDVFDLIQTPHTPAAIQAWQDRIRQCIMADDRNASCSVTILDDGAGGCTITILGTTSAGPYELVFALSGTGSLAISAIKTHNGSNGA